MNGRSVASLAWLLIVVPVVLAGCTSGDDDEYRVYSPAEDGRTAETSETTATSETADAAELPDESAVVADSAGPDAGDPTAATDVEAEPTTVEPSADPSPLPENSGLALTPEQQAELAAIAAASPPVDPASTGPRETKLLIPEQTFRKEGPEGAIRVSYDDLDLLKVLNMEPVTPDAPDHFPSWLKELDGQRIRLRGYMRPGFLAEDLPGFILARDTQACCFGPNTKAYDIIPTVMREGVTTDYIHLQPFDVVGIFHISVEVEGSLREPNKVEYLYYIDDAVVIRK